MPDMVTNTRSGIGAAGSSTQPSTALLGGFRASSTGAPGAGWLSAVRAGPPRRRRLFRRLQVSLRAVGQGGETIIPAQQRIADVSDEMELDEVYATERQLLYVAATRARDRLMISGVVPVSEFLADMQAGQSSDIEC